MWINIRKKELDEKEESNEYHYNMNFLNKPTCVNCQDDTSFPKHLPGKLRKNNIKSDKNKKMTKK